MDALDVVGVEHARRVIEQLPAPRLDARRRGLAVAELGRQSPSMSLGFAIAAEA